jgi:hypothetical protein
VVAATTDVAINNAAATSSANDGGAHRIGFIR